MSQVGQSGVEDGAATTSSPGQSGLRKGTLGPGRIAFFVVATVAPLAGIAGASPVVFAAVGNATPAIFILAGVLFAIFSVGYVAMSRHLSNAGGYIAYIARGFGPRAATGAGYLSVLTFFGVQLALWSQLAVFAQELILNLTGYELPVSLFLYGLLLIGTVVVCLGAELSIVVAGTILGLEMLALVILIGGGILFGWTHGNMASSLDLTGLIGPGIGIAFLFGVAAFVGFEATVVFSEEAKNPHKTMPRAVILSIGVIALSYALGTWALSLANGQNVQDLANDHPTELVTTTADLVVGPDFLLVVNVLIVTSLIASLIGSLNMFARVVFAMGRAGVLPHWLGTTTRRGAPARAAATIGVLVAVVIFCFQLAGADLIGVVFSWFLSLATATLIALLVATSISIIVFFIRNPGLESGWWKTRAAPLIAALGFTITAYLALVNYEMLLGGSGAIARWLLLLIPILAIGGWFTAGRLRVAPDFAADLS